MKKSIFREEKAQGAIEYLLLIGAAVLVVTIVVIAMTTMMITGKQQGEQGATDFNKQLNDLNKLKRY
jgi:uncharacterized protein (UPF0333 family)